MKLKKGFILLSLIIASSSGLNAMKRLSGTVGNSTVNSTVQKFGRGFSSKFPSKVPLDYYSGPGGYKPSFSGAGNYTNDLKRFPKKSNVQNPAAQNASHSTGAAPKAAEEAVSQNVSHSTGAPQGSAGASYSSGSSSFGNSNPYRGLNYKWLAATGVGGSALIAGLGYDANQQRVLRRKDNLQASDELKEALDSYELSIKGVPTEENIRALLKISGTWMSKLSREAIEDKYKSSSIATKEAEIKEFKARRIKKIGEMSKMSNDDDKLKMLDELNREKNNQDNLFAQNDEVLQNIHNASRESLESGLLKMTDGMYRRKVGIPAKAESSFSNIMTGTKLAATGYASALGNTASSLSDGLEYGKSLLDGIVVALKPNEKQEVDEKTLPSFLPTNRTRSNILKI